MDNTKNKEIILDLDLEEEISPDLEKLFSDAVASVEKVTEEGRNKESTPESEVKNTSHSDMETSAPEAKLNKTAAKTAVKKSIPKAPVPEPKVSVSENDKPEGPSVSPKSSVTQDFAEKKRQVLKARAEAEQYHNEDEKYKALYTRLYAEFDNYKKRIVKERKEIQKFGFEGLIKEFLPIIDNFERALAHSKDNQDFESFYQGIELIYTQFIQMLQSLGVISFDSMGEKFDPAKHDIMMLLEDDERESHTIVEEMRRGYFYHDRLLRAALVTVSQKSKKK